MAHLTQRGKLILWAAVAVSFALGGLALLKGGDSESLSGQVVGIDGTEIGMYVCVEDAAGEETLCGDVVEADLDRLQGVDVGDCVEVRVVRGSVAELDPIACG